jgi:hypothetical protein
LAILTLGFAFGCGESPPDNGGPTGNGDLTVSGELSTFDMEETFISASSESDLAEGNIQSDGSFEVTFASAQTAEEYVKPADPELTGFDGFSGFLCEGGVHEQVGTSIQFALVPGFTYVDDSSPRIVTLNSPSVRANILTPTPVIEGFYVRWVYAQESVSLQHECQNGEYSMDMDLDAGWNEFVLDTRDRDNVMQYTGDRPAEVEWTVEE